LTKGLILAGGAGTRLHPITKVINKHLIPIGKAPMIHYPIHTLVKSGVTEIMVISGPQSIGPLAEFLGSGSAFGCNFYFRVQERPAGISDGIRLAKEFTSDDKLMVMLGDNLVSESFGDIVSDFERGSVGCRVFLKELANVEGLGVAQMEGGQLARVVEKPTEFVSNFAVTGLYLFDNRCFDMIDELYPSGRNELEVTDLINAYIDLNACDSQVLQGDWLDAGTFESLAKAASIFDTE
jgi:glucose-1-phosphate thymidylyltransferase